MPADSPEALANAHLTNAAPDLLAALIGLVELPACQASYSKDSDMARRVDRAVTAILKAGVVLPDEWPETAAERSHIENNEGEANARLSAAAPDLLKALKRMRITHQHISPASCQEADDAIAAAEGRAAGGP